MPCDNTVVLGLSTGCLRAWADTWSDGGLWDDIARLAELAWNAADEHERCMRWHHLVMAVGNFKRQGNRRLRPRSIASVATVSASVVRRDRYQVPGLAQTVLRDNDGSWKSLELSLKGSGTPTTTTLLAALWPDSHHVLDWRVLAAVAGLGIVAGGDSDLGLVAGDTKEQLTPDLDRYAKIREMLVTKSREAGLPLAKVERALYRITQQVRGNGMTWREYGKAVKATAQAIPSASATRAKVSAPSGTANEDGPADDEQDKLPSAP